MMYFQNSSTVNIPKENDVDAEPMVEEEATLDGASIKDGYGKFSIKHLNVLYENIIYPIDHMVLMPSS